MGLGYNRVEENNQFWQKLVPWETMKKKNPTIKELEEKINFIIDNDGSELSNSYEGLYSFLRYCGEREEILLLLQKYIEADYQILYDEIEEEKSYWLEPKKFNENMKFCILIHKDTKEELFKIDKKLYTNNLWERKIENKPVYIFKEELKRINNG